MVVSKLDHLYSRNPRQSGLELPERSPLVSGERYRGEFHIGIFACEASDGLNSLHISRALPEPISPRISGVSEDTRGIV